LERVEGNYQQALEGYDLSLSLIQKLRGERSISSVLIESNIAVTLQKMGDLDGAEALMKKNVGLREEIFGPDHPRTAAAHHILGRILAEQPDKASEAEYHFRRALALRQDAIPDQWQVGATQLELGRLLLDTSRFAEAEPLLTAGLIRMMVTRGTDHSASTEGKRNLYELYQQWQRPERYMTIRDSLSGMGYDIDVQPAVAANTTTE
jgi:tetratricopeptide (TPR) repeat protein